MNVFKKTEAGDPTEKNSKAQKIQNMGISMRQGRQQKTETEKEKLTGQARARCTVQSSPRKPSKG